MKTKVQNIQDQKQVERYREIGLRIAYQRKKAGYTQLDLTSIAGISRSHLSQIESGNEIPSLSYLFKIADVLGIEASVFIKDL